MPRPPTLMLSRPRSKPKAPRAAAAEGLSKLTGALLLGGPMSVAVVAGDFLSVWGDDRGPRGDMAAWLWGRENGVDTGGVGAAPVCCEGVRPCWDAPGLMGVDMAAAARRC